MGSLVGALYATGMRVSFMERLACTLRWRHWVDLTVPKMGMIAGEKVHQMMSMLTRGLDMQAAAKPLAIVAAELVSKQAVTFRDGPIADAVRASIAIPGVFVPYVKDGKVYVDGGVVDRVPIQAARGLGADIVIAVDVASVQRERPPQGIVDVILQSLDMMQDEVYRYRAKTADIYVEPDVSEVGTSQFHKAKQAIDAGYQAALAQMDSILELMRSRGVPCTAESTQSGTGEVIG
jgi:NTE family protein